MGKRKGLNNADAIMVRYFHELEIRKLGRIGLGFSGWKDCGRKTVEAVQGLFGVCDVAYGMDDLECVWCKYACLRKWDNGGGGAGILWRCDFAIAMCGKHSIPSSSSSFRVDLHALQVS
jgi:hypothetical protein